MKVKNTLAFSQIGILVIGIIAFSYLVSEASVAAVARIISGKSL